MITARDLIRREAYKDNRRQVYQNPTVPAIRAINQPMTEGQNAPISAAANSSGPGKSPLPSLSNPTFASQVSNPVPSAAAPPPSMGAAGKVGRATNDPDIAASGTLDPAEKHLRDLIAQRDAIPADKDVQDDPSRLHSFYKTAQMANRYAMRSGGDPGTVLGATLGGGLRGLFDRKSAIIEGNHEKNDEITKAIAAAEIPVDKAHTRQYQDAVVQERKEAHEQTSRDREEKEANRKAEAEVKVKEDALKSIARLKTVNVNSPIIKGLAKTGGISEEDIGQGWDYSKDDSRMVNGVYFDKDKISGVWKQSGLPPELSKQTVPYHVLDENDKDTGDVYQLLPAEAAKLRSSLALQNKRIKSQEEIEGERESARASEGAANRTSRETIASDNRDFKSEMDTARQKYGVAGAQRKATAAYMEVHPKATPEEVNAYLDSVGFEVPKASPKAHADFVPKK